MDTTLLVSLVAIFVLGMFVHKPLAVCARMIPFCSPIGLAVTLVWLGLLAAHLVGKNVNPVILATVMGGSLITHAYAMERRNPRTAVVLVMASIVATYALMTERWILLASGIAILAFFWVAIVRRPIKQDNSKV